MNANDVTEFVKDGRIVWTMTTIGYIRYTLNLSTWLTTVAKVPWTLCIICCDVESERFFRREKIPYISWKGEGIRKTQDGMAAFGTPSFEKCNRQKLSILEWFTKHFAECGYTHSLYLDGDIVVKTDPWPLLIPEFSKSNILFQCDCYNSTEHNSETNCGVICSGVVATHHTSLTQSELYTFDPVLWESASVLKQDQPYIKERLLSTNTPYTILGRRLFGNGVWMKTGAWKDDNWCLLHYNYLVSSSKRTAMKTNKHWLI